MINIKDIYWLAGWLEGEGSFTIEAKGKSRRFRIELCTSDLDVLKHAKSIMRTDETIYLRKQGYTQLGTKKKPEYYLKVVNNEAIQWMMTLYSLMGERRKSKIKEIISMWKLYVSRGQGICRKCRSKLEYTRLKGGWNKGKLQTYCWNCRRNANA